MHQQQGGGPPTLCPVVSWCFKAGQGCRLWSALQLLPGPLLLCFINNAAQKRVGRELHRQLDRRSLQHIAAGWVGGRGG